MAEQEAKAADELLLVRDAMSEGAASAYVGLELEVLEAQVRAAAAAGAPSEMVEAAMSELRTAASLRAHARLADVMGQGLMAIEAAEFATVVSEAEAAARVNWNPIAGMSSRQCSEMAR